MNFDVTVEIEAKAERVWRVLVDVETWPSWTPSMTSVERVDSGQLRVGSATRIRQRRLGSMLWRVTELNEARSFTWEARRPGLRLVASHLIEDSGPTGTKVTLSIQQDGVLGSSMAPLTRGFARSNVEAEAQGLKKHVEMWDSGR